MYHKKRKREYAYVRCDKTGKVIYASEIDAKIHLSKITIEKYGQKRPRRAYKCQFCHKWHLTSQPFVSRENEIAS